MTPKRRVVSHQLEFDFSDSRKTAPKELVEALPKPHDAKADPKAIADYAVGADERHRVGKVPLVDKLARTIADAGTLGEDVMDELYKSRGRPEEFTLVLESLDYAALRGQLQYGINGIKAARADEDMDLSRMRRYLEQGIVFDEATRKWSGEAIAMDADMLAGGTGYGKGVRIHGDIQFPYPKDRLADAVTKMLGEDARIKKKGGKPVKPKYANVKQLQAIYASEIKKRRAAARRAERRIDEI